MGPRLRQLQSPQLPTFGNLEVHDSGLEAILAAEQAKYLALAVAFEEFRRSAPPEGQMSAHGIEVVRFRELVEAIDHLEDSIASAPTEAKALYTRLLQLPLEQLRSVLSAERLEPDNPVGRIFDPGRHELLCTVHDAAFPNHRVIEIWRTGWRRGAEIFRRAKVVVNDLGISDQQCCLHQERVVHSAELPMVEGSAPKRSERSTG
jgi:molecular chaperone GrpE (heat shock protein)